MYEVQPGERGALRHTLNAADAALRRLGRPTAPLVIVGYSRGGRLAVTGGRWWYGNCAWDAFGICAALESDGRIETSCPDCGEPVSVEVHRRRPDDESLLFHCLVPAARWWDDIVFT